MPTQQSNDDDAIQTTGLLKTYTHTKVKILLTSSSARKICFPWTMMQGLSLTGMFTSSYPSSGSAKTCSPWSMIIDIQGRSQTLYTTPCNGVVSHGAQIGGLPVFADQIRKNKRLGYDASLILTGGFTSSPPGTTYKWLSQEDLSLWAMKQDSSLIGGFTSSPPGTTYKWLSQEDLSPWAMKQDSSLTERFTSSSYHGTICQWVSIKACSPGL